MEFVCNECNEIFDSKRAIMAFGPIAGEINVYCSKKCYKVSNS